MRAGLPLVVGDMARCVQCGADAPFQAVISSRWRGAGSDRPMGQRYSATAHVGYCNVVIIVHAHGATPCATLELITLTWAPMSHKTLQHFVPSIMQSTRGVGGGLPSP